jgi:hypothetical protein
MGKKMNNTKPRWTVTLTYYHGDGPRSSTVNIHELYELQDIVERGPNFYAIESIVIGINTDADHPKVTVEEAAKQ